MSQNNNEAEDDKKMQTAIMDKSDEIYESMNKNMLREYVKDDAGDVILTDSERELFEKYSHEHSGDSIEETNVNIQTYQLLDTYNPTMLKEMFETAKEKLNEQYCNPDAAKNQPDKNASMKQYIAGGLGFLVGGPVGAAAGWAMTGAVVNKNACDSLTGAVAEGVTNVAMTAATGGAGEIVKLVGGTVASSVGEKIRASIDKKSPEEQAKYDNFISSDKALDKLIRAANRNIEENNDPMSLKNRLARSANDSELDTDLEVQQVASNENVNNKVSSHKAMDLSKFNKLSISADKLDRFEAFHNTESPEMKRKVKSSI